MFTQAAIGVCLSSVSLLLLLYSSEFAELHQLRRTVFIVLFCGLFLLMTRSLLSQAMLYMGKCGADFELSLEIWSFTLDQE